MDGKRIAGRLGSALVGSTALVASGLVAAGTNYDGDPLENYDFTGDLPLADYVSHENARIHRHGLWTIKESSRLDPFGDRRYWSLANNTVERVEVYYGSWPKWCSRETYRASATTPVPARTGDDGPRFTLDVWSVEDDYEAGDPLRVTDLLGDGVPTILVDYWNGGANSGSSAQLIRLAGTTPATAEVQVVWSGQYHSLVELDDDPAIEIVDTDWCYHYTSCLPHKGLWHKVVLDWDADRQRFVVGSRELHLARTNALRREAEQPEVDIDAWKQQRIASALRDVPKDGVVRGDGHERDVIQLRLAGSLARLLYLGCVDEALDLLHRLDFEDWDSSYSREPRPAMKRDQWWTAFLAATRESPYWASLVERYPRLADLR